jgi:hypothetical protein
MKRIITLFAALTLLATVGALAQSRVHAGIFFGNGRLNGFYLGLTNEYSVPDARVRYLYDQGIPDEDMPDILFIYTHSHYSLDHIVNLRLRGASWNQLYTWCGIRQDVYYYQPRDVRYRPHYYAYRGYDERYRSGPPYGNAYGYYKKHRDYDRDRYDGYGDRDERDGRPGKHKGHKNH